MRILVLSPEIPFPVRKGNQARIHGIIRELLTGNELHVCVDASKCALGEAADAQIAMGTVYPGARISVHAPRSHRRPSILGRIRKALRRRPPAHIPDPFRPPEREYTELVEEVIASFKPGLIWVNYARLVQAIPGTFGGRIVIDQHDIQTDRVRSAMELRVGDGDHDLDALLKRETELWLRAHTLVSINPREAERTTRIIGGVRRVVTLPMSFDFVAPSSTGLEQPDSLLFVGSASPFNIDGVAWFVEHCWAQIRSAVPGATLTIVGDVGMTPRLRPVVEGIPGIRRVGRVDDLGAYYTAASIVVCPLRGGAGMKVKLVEALFYAKAVVTTSIGSDGVELIDGRHARIADTIQDFSKAVIALLMDPEARRTLGKEALLVARAHYAPTLTRQALAQIISA